MATSGRSGSSLTRPAAVLVLALAISLGACEASVPQSSAPLPFFPTDVRDGPRVTMTARSSGRLTLEVGCLWLRSGGEVDLMIWPAAHRVEWWDGRLVVVNNTNEVVARVGDQVTVGGGEWLAMEAQIDIDREVEAIIGRPIPPPCRTGRYWLGGVIGDGG